MNNMEASTICCIYLVSRGFLDDKCILGASGNYYGKSLAGISVYAECVSGRSAVHRFNFYEAAKMDGASKWQCFCRITFPVLTKLSIPLIVSTFASNFNNFGNIYMITQGGPARTGSQFAGSTDILASTIYKMTTWSNRYELSATLSVISFLIVGTLTLVNLHMSGAFKEVD